MMKHSVQKETISATSWKNLLEKFSAEYSMDDLKAFYSARVPVSVRWNNRNVYGQVLYHDGSYFVSNYFRITRDGTPVRMYVELLYD